MINLVPLNPGKMRHIFLLMTMLLYISGEGYLLIECTSIDTEASDGYYMILIGTPWVCY